MLKNKRLLLTGIGAALVAAVAVVAVVAASSGGNDGRESVSAEDETRLAGDGEGLAVCVEDVPDCNDMIVNPDSDVSEEPGAVSSDEPVSADDPIGGPITSIDDIDPNECNLVHNIDACQEQATGAALKDLVVRPGIEADAIAVVSAEMTEWPDACLGVQQPGVACAEVITPGFKIVLGAGSAEYEYHTDATGAQTLLVD
jgi:hypothetical protein